MNKKTLRMFIDTIDATNKKFKSAPSITEWTAAFASHLETILAAKSEKKSKKRSRE